MSVRDWFLVDLAMSSGLRVSELAGLAVADFGLGSRGRVFVRRGKGGRSRWVRLDPGITAHARRFLAWKARSGEPTSAVSPVFRSPRGGRALTVRAIQKAMKRCFRRAKLPERFHAHSLRHSFATHLYARCRNLRLVQKQLGHSRITTTQIYADVLDEDLARAFARPLYGARR